MLSRNTYLEINLNNIKENVSHIIKQYHQYQYYFGVVKADCYGHGDIKTVKAIIAGGCNYLAVASLEEALYIRKEINDIPILCFGHVPIEYLSICQEKNITVTIHSLEYAKEIQQNSECIGIKVHVKLNTGMNRLGISKKEDLTEVFNIIEEKKLLLEGIYTHIYCAESKSLYEKQINKFQNLTAEINLNTIKIVHISASEAIENYPKPTFVNGCRLGIMMYGFTKCEELQLKSTLKLVSEIVQIHTLNKGETVGYGATYEAKKDNERIAVVSIGYADGVIRKNKGRFVYIKDKKYEIVGNICMDMLFVKVDDTITTYDKVEILRDVQHINEVANYLETIPYEVICSIGKRVTRIYR